MLPSTEFREQTYAMGFPAGWYAVCESHELKGKKILSTTVCGEPIVLFRSASGPHALDAHCPHMGADLGAGKIVDDCIQCPFHNWRIAGDGAVTQVPYQPDLPHNLRARRWILDERYGFVFVYWGAQEAPYALPQLPAIDNGDMRYVSRLDAGDVAMHIAEFAENSADLQHFGPLHSDMYVPWTRIRVPGITVNHEASWYADDSLSHVAYFTDRAVLEAFGRALPSTAASAKITFWGPGSLVWFEFDVDNLGKIIMFQTHTPVDPLRLRVRFRWWAQPHIPRPLVSYVVGSWITQWKRDVAIWERKIFQPKPMLVKSDGPIHRMRQWYRQFEVAPA